jgi:hypothetical protein
MINNDTLSKEMPYLLSAMIFALIIVMYQVFMLHRPVIRDLQIHHMEEKFSNAEVHQDSRSERFFGGQEPPRFHGISDTSIAGSLRVSTNNVLTNTIDANGNKLYYKVKIVIDKDGNKNNLPTRETTTTITDYPVYDNQSRTDFVENMSDMRDNVFDNSLHGY